MSIRVVLADDDALVRSGIGMLISAEQDFELVAEVPDGAAAVHAVRAHNADVAILDVRMPVMDGVEATKLITADDTTAAVGRTVAVLTLSNYRVSESVYAALRAGSSGFILKDAAPDELVAAIRAVADGEAWLDPAVARDLIQEFAKRPATLLPPPGALGALTSRERQVLALMAHGMSNGEIARHLVVELATVKTHVSRILMRLGARDRSQAVAFAYRSRLVGPDDPAPRP